MLIFCPSCGNRFEIEGHTEAAAAAKCPSCSHVFSETDSANPAASKLKFVAGGEMDPSLARKSSSNAAAVPAMKKLLPADCAPGEIISAIGAGVLMEAESIETRAVVLLRKLSADGVLHEDAERWGAVAGSLQGIRHASLVTVLGVGPLDGATHVVVERAVGRNLDDFLSGRPFGFRQAAHICLNIADALAAAHRAGVVHGNLKPSNVIVDSQGKARVCDFGYYPSAIVDGEPVQSEHVMRWVPYAPPEAVRGGVEKGAESADSYSLGALLYYMLTGRAPFVAADARTLIAQVLGSAPALPGSVNTRVPAELEALVMRSLDKDPERRPANAQAFAVEIRRIEREGLLAHAPARSRPGRRRKAFAAAIAMIGLGFGGYATVSRLQEKSAISRAESLSRQAESLDAEDVDGRISLLRFAAGEAAATAEMPRYRLDLAKVLLNAGRREEASEELALAISRAHPVYAEARELYARVAAETGRVDTALEQWTMMIEEDAAAASSIVEGGVHAAMSLLERDLSEEALALLEYVAPLARREGGKNAEARYALGRARLKLGQRTRARPEFVAALEGSSEREILAKAALALVETVDPRGVEFELSPGHERLLSASPLAQAHYMRILVSRDMLNRAESMAAEVVSTDLDSDSASWLALAIAELRELSGDLAGARQKFEEAQDRAAGGIRVAVLARVGLGRLELRSGRASAASAIFAGIQRQYGSTPEARESIACALVGQGDALRLLEQPDESSRKYREATDDIYRSYRKQYLAAMCGLGELAMEVRDTSRVGIAFRSLGSENDAGFFGAIAKAMTGRLSESELSDAAALESRDMAARAHYCIGLRRALVGDEGGARESFAKAAEVAGSVSWYRFLAERRID